MAVFFFFENFGGCLAFRGDLQKHVAHSRVFCFGVGFVFWAREKVVVEFLTLKVLVGILVGQILSMFSCCLRLFVLAGCYFDACIGRCTCVRGGSAW